MRGRILSGLIAGALVVIAIVAISAVNISRQIEEIRLQKESTVNADSIASAIEKKIFDSLKVEFQKRDLEIQQLRKSVNKTRLQNEELTRRFNSANVNMPDF
jgi:biopolymer transport protein ExbB/TolQ